MPKNGVSITAAGNESISNLTAKNISLNTDSLLVGKMNSSVTRAVTGETKMKYVSESGSEVTGTVKIVNGIITQFPGI